jgi:hypothetical protein
MSDIRLSWVIEIHFPNVILRKTPISFLELQPCSSPKTFETEIKFCTHYCALFQDLRYLPNLEYVLKTLSLCLERYYLIEIDEMAI